MTLRILLTALVAIASVTPLVTQPHGKRIVIIAGRPSHGPGMHEFRAGSLLLQKALAGLKGVTVDVIPMGWPKKTVDGQEVDDHAALDGADAIFIYADGGRGHPAIQGDRMRVIDALAKRGVGLAFGHYAVEVPVGDPAAAMHRWVGGYYETNYSVNPMWAPNFDKYPSHPVTRGVGPFSNNDEWYFNMRWTSDEKLKSRILPLLVAAPSDDVRDGPYVSPRGPYDHIIADKGRAETMMWVFERPDGGRSFGFTGGHTHTNWGDVNQRRIVLNALLWIAKVAVPSTGVVDTITAEDLKDNLDPKPPRKQ
jgi:hypothetical protein